jgi:hypothetical protein
MNSYDNLFSANHRNAMLEYHKGTMAQIYTIEDMTNHHKSELQMEHDCDRFSKGYCSACTKIAELGKDIGSAKPEHRLGGSYVHVATL